MQESGKRFLHFCIAVYTKKLLVAGSVGVIQRLK